MEKNVSEKKELEGESRKVIVEDFGETDCQTGEGDPTVHFVQKESKSDASSAEPGVDADVSEVKFTGALGTPPPLDAEADMDAEDLIETKEIDFADSPALSEEGTETSQSSNAGESEWAASPDTDHVTLNGLSISEAEKSKQRDVLRFLDTCHPHLADEQRAQTLRDMAEIHAHLGETEKSLECTQSALQLNLDDASTLGSAYRAALRTKNSEASVHALEALLLSELVPAKDKDAIRRELASLYQSAERFEDALAQLKAVSEGSLSLGVALEIARLHVRLEQIGDAADTLEAAAYKANDPLASELRARALRWRLQAGDNEGAMPLIQSLSASNANSATIDATLDFAAAKLSDPALRLTRRRTSANPSSTDLVDLAIVSRFRSTEPKVAIECLENAQDAAQGAAKRLIWTELAALYQNAEQWSELADLLREVAAEEENPEQKAATLARVGDLLAFYCDEKSQALVAYEQALSVVPNHRASLEGAGRIYRREGAMEQWIVMHTREMAELQEDSPAYAQSAFRLGEILVGIEDQVEQGIVHLKKALKNSAIDRLSICSTLESTLESLGKSEDLLEFYRSEVAVSTGTIRSVWIEKAANLAAELGHDELAIDLLRDAGTQEQSSIPSTTRTLIHLLRRNQKWTELADTYSRILAESTELSEKERLTMTLGLAEARGCAGQLEAAAEVFHVASESTESSDATRRQAGRFFIDHDMPHELLRLYQQAAQQSEGLKRGKWLLRAAEAAEQLGEMDRALRLLGEANAIVPEQARPAFARIALVTGDFEALQTSLSKDADAWRKATLAEATGNTEKALKNYRSLFEAGDKLAEAPYHRLRAECGQFEDLEEGARSGDWEVRSLSIFAQVANGDIQGSLKQLHAYDNRPLSFDFLMFELAQSAKDVARATDSMERWPLNQSDKRDVLERRADALEAMGDSEASKAVRAEVHKNDGHFILHSKLEVQLDAEGDRQELASLLKEIESRSSDPSVQAAASMRRAELYSQVGWYSEAINAWEKAHDFQPGSPQLRSRIGLVDAAKRNQNADRTVASLESLAKFLPLSKQRSDAHWAVAKCHLSQGELDLAKVSLNQGLEETPNHRPCLSTLASLYPDGDGAAMIEPLLRAFESADAEDMLALGRSLVPLLLEDERYDVAESAALRLHAQSPSSQAVLMLLFEVRMARGESELAAQAAMWVADCDDADDDHRWDAALRAVQIVQNHGSDTEIETVVTWLKHSKFVQDVGTNWRQRHCSSLLAHAASSFEREVDDLEWLVADEDVPPRARDLYTLRLADVCQHELNDDDKALAALASIELQGEEHTFKRILELAEGLDDRARSVEALESALAQASEVDLQQEIRARRLIVEHLDGGDAQDKSTLIIPHLERLAELVPQDTSVFERLAEGFGDADPKRTLRYQAALLQKKPERMDIYRALHKGAMDQEDSDLAFLVEAALVGLGEATEDETYFYRQRRAKLSTSPTSSDLINLDAIGPDLPAGLLTILSEIEAVAPDVFPPDLASYGPSDRERTAQVASASQALGFILGAVPSIHVTAMDVAPTVEPGIPYLAVVPSAIASMSIRHQQCVMGGLLSRCRFGGVIGSPTAQNPISAKQIEYLIHAALSIATRHEPEISSAVYSDLRKRLESTMSNAALIRIADSSKDLHLEEGLGQRVIDELTRTSARVAMLSARDPAAAAECYLRYPAFMGAEDMASSRAHLLEAMAFAVSEEHRTLRKQLSWGIDHE